MDSSIIKGRCGIAKHLVVISYDAFSEDNWEMARSLPNLSKFIKNGAYSTKLRSVYPTLTYTVHSTIVTGVYPDKHGIIHNNPFQPFSNEKERNWYWFRESIKVPAIYDEVKKCNMSTAGIFWPVSGRSSIKYNMPEIAALKNENQLIKILRNGNPLYCITMELKYGGVRKGIEEPYLDDFTAMCAVDTIRRKKPNLLLMHLIELDDAKHKHGTGSEEVKKAILRMDKRLGDILEAACDAGIQDDTVYIVVGDHGQIDVNCIVHLNNLLKENGLIFEEKGELKWRAYIQSAGGAAYLHIKDGDKEAEISSVAALENAMMDGKYGIERIYYRNELDHFHVDKAIRYMIEARVGYSFDDKLGEPAIVDLKEKKIRHATHGYSPDKANYKCNFIVSGQKIIKDYQLGEIQMVDIAPTMAKILGIELKNCDGRALDEIFC